ncbi:MAG: aminoglycoside phosphotransferase family protein [Bacteroidetes bacterium]|nr:aminoglycoside phosphotransferase family protein [Bacteroidota bacterium]
MIPQQILEAFELSTHAGVHPLGSGHIHKTFKVEDKRNFVLQRINKNIFTRPEIIAANNLAAFQFLKEKFNNYYFLQALPDHLGNRLAYDDEGFAWRLYPLIEHTMTINEINTEQEALEAARGFGELTKKLNGADISKFHPTLDRFHDLTLRYQQFENALELANPDLIREAKNEIDRAKTFTYLVEEYNQMINNKQIPLRITHNDTKVNNILFDAQTKKAVCVIDLDTLMPGYYIYDLGDMVRTFVSPVSEEEKDLTKITFRKNVFEALLSGYLSEMGSVLTTEEKKHIPFAGKMMTYIMALRFLADHLRGNTYYHVSYREQNLVRAKNQFRLLELIVDNAL